jgi:hypothetical protein
MIIAHTLINSIAFIGYTLLRPRTVSPSFPYGLEAESAPTKFTKRWHRNRITDVSTQAWPTEVASRAIN